MKKNLISLSLLSIMTVCEGQNSLPSYKDIVVNFFSNYAFIPDEKTDVMIFAKKKTGWYIEIVDRYKQIVKSSELYWSLEKNDFLKIESVKLAYEPPDDNIYNYLNNINTDYRVYDYERCKYYGYNEWDVDMIKDFGNSMPVDDTLAEGLARAYAYHAERFLWYGFGGTSYDDDSLKIKLNNSELPSHEKLTKFIFFANKSFECYRTIAERNPQYRTLIGNVKMKLANEQFHQFQQLLISGDSLRAKEIFSKIELDDISRTIGYNYLSSCPLNSILITYGDNDTYPLWYLQKKENYRQDVTVINYSLLGFPPYLSMLKRNHVAKFSTTLQQLNKDEFNYFMFNNDSESSSKKTLELSELISIIQENSYPSSNHSLFYSTYPTKEIKLTIDRRKFSKINSQPNLSSKIEIKLTDNFFLNDLIIFDLINTNIYARPICFTSKPEFISSHSLQLEGSVYQILPIDSQKLHLNAEIENKKIIYFLNKQYKPANIKDDNRKIYRKEITSIPEVAYSKLLLNLIILNNRAELNKWTDKYEKMLAGNEFVASFDFSLADSLLKKGYKKIGIKHLENIAEFISYNYNHYNEIEFYLTKKMCKDYFQYIKNIIDKYGEDSKLLDRLINEEFSD